MKKITLIKAKEADCAELHSLQITAFADMLSRYKDYETSPGAEPKEKIVERMRQDNTDYYFINLYGKNIGGIRIVRKERQVYRISQMFILPQYQNKGYAQEAIKDIELLYSDAKTWELDTIKQEENLCHLYEKMGYKRTGKERELQPGMTLIDYVKQTYYTN